MPQVMIPRKLREKDGGHPFVEATGCPVIRGFVAPSKIHGNGVYTYDRIPKGKVFEMPASWHVGFNNLPRRSANVMLVRVRKGAGVNVCILATKDIEPLEELTLRDMTGRVRFG